VSSSMREEGLLGGFTKRWLALRAPYDARARNSHVLSAVTEAVADCPSISIVDLGCGIGATLRALSPSLPKMQHWRLVDNNVGALDCAQAIAVAAGVEVRTILLDLVNDLQAALDGPVNIVTTSAFLDLVSQTWLEQLVWRTVARHLPLYAALTYDGRVVFKPIDPRDEAVIAAVNHHQRSDKGFGPALGPNAPTCAIKLFQMAGYDVLHGHSDWTFGPVDREIQLDIFTAWADATRETGAVPIAELDLWLEARREAVALGRSQLRIGHVDFLARPLAER
jgi:Methyltransferase small domain